MAKRNVIDLRTDNRIRELLDTRTDVGTAVVHQANRTGVRDVHAKLRTASTATQVSRLPAATTRRETMSLEGDPGRTAFMRPERGSDRGVQGAAPGVVAQARSVDQVGRCWPEVRAASIVR